jgi:hypothetical protein
MLTERIVQLNEAIKGEAARLGLIFVSGPDTIAQPFDASDIISPVNFVQGQARCTYLFAVAEKEGEIS